MMYDDDYREPPSGCIRFMLVAVLALLVGFIVCFTSCTTIKEVPVEVIKVQTEYRDRIVYDSIYQHDSIYIKDKGDTLYIYKYQDKYIYSAIHDTVSVERIDSIPYAVEVVKEVNKLTTNQKNMIRGFWFFILIIVGYIVYIIFKYKTKIATLWK